MTRLARPLHGAPRLNGVRVLVVDDAPGVRGIVFDVLTRDGAKVTTVGTAEEALLALQREPVTCSLSDVAMPADRAGSGTAAAARGRDTRSGADRLHGRPASRERLASGFQLSVEKPVGLDELIGVVEILALRERHTA